ncbi:MAG: EAL domain-containing protein [Cognaticolwellia sp.]
MTQLFGLHHRHYRFYLLLCFLPVTIFAYIHYLKGNYLLTSTLIFASLAFAISFIKIRQNNISQRYKVLITVAMWCCLATASYSVGIHGIYYSFPSIVALFFLMPIRTSLIISVPSAFIFLALTILHGEPLLTLKLLTSLLLTIIFTAFFSYFAKYQQDAVGLASRKDHLTKIASRHAFNEWLNAAYATTKVKSITIIHLDIDYFGTVNDTYGFEVGDKAIQEFALRLTEIVESNSTVKKSRSYLLARFSGDVFTIGMTNLPKDVSVIPLVSLLQQVGSELFVLDDHSTSLSVSAGVVHTERVDGRFSNIIDNTEFSLRQAKKLGRKSVQIFDDNITQQLKEQKHIAQELSKAINNNQFHMLFMPIYRDKDKTIAGAELLIRCDREELINYGPDKYITIAEDCGLIEQIDYWVLKESFDLIANNPILRMPSIEFYSINISSHQLHNAEFVGYMTHLSEKFNVAPSLIELEITETCLVDADMKAIETLLALKRLGFKLSLDDFGTGYTAFNQLKKYPLDCLKIDKSFVSGDQEIEVPLTGMSDVILSIAKLYELKVIAEGVETEEQYLKLKAQGCHYFQGYWLSKPISLKKYIALLSS